MHEGMGTIGDTVGHGMGFAVQLSGVVDGGHIEPRHGEVTGEGLHT